MKKSYLILIILFILLAAGIASSSLFNNKDESDPSKDKEDEGVVITAPQDRTNILLLGVDSKGDINRSDTIMVASLGEDPEDIVLISVPRDSRIEIPGYGLDKLNHSYAYGGYELTEEAVTGLLGIRLHYYAEINFTAFREMVDLLDGVDIEVDQAVVDYYPHIFEHSGLQHLNGKQALYFVRFRKDSQGDIGRIQRQQRFLKAMADKAVSLSTIPNIPKIITSLGRNLSTDIPLTKVVSLANRLRKIDPTNITTGVIPGENKKIDGLWYWELDYPAMEELLVDLGLKSCS